MSQIISGKHFIIPGVNGRSAASSDPFEPPANFKLAQKRHCSRREWLKRTGIGAAGLWALGMTAQKSSAFIIEVAAGIIHAIEGLVCAAFHVAALPIVGVIHAAKWVAHHVVCHHHHDQFHYSYAAPFVPDRVVAPVQSDLYPGTYFEMNQFGRMSGSDRFVGFQDLNTPEMLRMRHEMPAGGPYRLLPERFAMRRQLTNRDRELFHVTLGQYQQNGYVPPANSLSPVYAREVTDPRGYLHTGFGLLTSTGQKNFLLANTSSWS